MTDIPPEGQPETVEVAVELRVRLMADDKVSVGVLQQDVPPIVMLGILSTAVALMQRVVIEQGKPKGRVVVPNLRMAGRN